MSLGYLRVYDWLLDRPRRSSSIEVDAAMPAPSRDEDSGEVVAVA
jgi:hypothetical protein